MATQASKDKSVWVVGFLSRAKKFRPGESSVDVLRPRTFVPTLSSARAREERQIYVELEGTRILRSSSVTPHRQTVIIMNNFNFSLTCDVCGGEKKGGQKQSQSKRHIWQTD